jgi:hypothetical protein
VARCRRGLNVFRGDILFDCVRATLLDTQVAASPKSERALISPKVGTLRVISPITIFRLDRPEPQNLFRRYCVVSV